MRRLPGTLCASIGLCIYIAAVGSANSSPLGLTLDLIAPSTPCNGSKCPADINLPALGAAPLDSSTFFYAPGQGSPANYVATMAMDNAVANPLVCDEIAGSVPPYNLGPAGALRFAPTFANPLGNGLLEFGAGGPSNVDLSSMSYDGSTSPSVVKLQYVNTASRQALCYPINRIGAFSLMLANGSIGGDRIFFDGLESGHSVGEPWVSVQTVNSPSTGTLQPSASTSIAAQPNDMVYVVQIHNPVAGWHLDFGYDAAYFGMANNGSVPPSWCVLTSAQPGALTSCGTNSGQYGVVTTAPSYTLASRDIQTATHSVYLQVVLAGSTVATSTTTGWTLLTAANFPALAAIFPPPGMYPQRLDDKVAVASANNLPVLTIGSISCPNTASPAACSIADQDGNPIPAGAQQGQYLQGQLTITSQLATNGQNVGMATINPIAYFVDPNGGTNLPSALTPTTTPTVTCPANNGIVANASLVAHAGGWALQASFVGSYPYIPGTVVCIASFTPPTVNVLALPAVTQSFAITMMPQP